MLEPGHGPVHGAQHCGHYYRKIVRLVEAKWHVEHAIACDDEAVIEWSMLWTSPEDGQRYIVHGTEWYVFDGGLISEIRSYFRHGAPADTELSGFPYSERGYRVIDRPPPIVG